MALIVRNQALTASKITGFLCDSILTVCSFDPCLITVPYFYEQFPKGSKKFFVDLYGFTSNLLHLQSPLIGEKVVCTMENCYFYNL